MQEVSGILAGVFVSGAASLCIGLLLFYFLRIQLARTEYLSLAFVAGSACFSQIIFFLASIHLLWESVFIAISLVASALTIRVSRGISAPVRFKPLPRRWKWFAAALFVSFGVVYLVNAMAPEMSPDGAAYHLPFVARYLRAHGFERIPDNFYGSLSQGIELLFLPAVSIGGASSAALVHFLFLADLSLMISCYGRRFGFPIPALAAAFLAFASPVVGWDGAAAYVDVAAAAVTFALFYLLQVWDVDRNPKGLIVIGILAGFSYAAKYTAGIAVPYALAFVSWKLWSDRKPLFGPVLTVAALAAMFILPWTLRNAVQFANPLAPFANYLFPNPYVHVSFEQGYLTYLHHYHLTNWLRAPWELTVKGERLQGFFGPVFLLTPLALLSLRRPAGRRLLIAGAVFAMPWFLNIGSRFLIPALPLLALGLALAAERPSWLLPGIMVLHAFLSWYASPLRYCDRYAPRIVEMPLRAAFRIEPEEVYLARKNSGYLIDRMIERQVPAGNRVFSFEPIPEAWTMREIVVAQNAAENELLADILRRALAFDGSSTYAMDFRFPRALLRGVRATQTAQLPEEMWSVSEFQLLEGSKLLAANPKWRVSANPNPWNARLAFDGSLVTRWRSWQAAAPGMFVEVTFSKPTFLDQVTLRVSSDSLHSQVCLRGMDPDATWRDLPGHPTVALAPVAGNLRAAAVRELVTRGIHYLLVTPAAFGANDFDENAAAWGIRKIGDAEGAHLYHLDPDHDAPAPGLSVALSSGAPVLPGAYDDVDPRMHLHGAWTHDPQFQDAYGHTLTYSNIPGSSISLVFCGNAFTYVYTRASNRGIAEVWVDGQPKGQVDLYAPDTAWRSHRRYDGLGPGRHVIEIRVTGQRNPHAIGCFVDLDALIVE